MAEQPKAQGTRAYATACPLQHDHKDGLVVQKITLEMTVSDTFVA